MPPDYLLSSSESASPSPVPLAGGSQSDMSDSRPYASSSTGATLKRRASSSFEDVQEEASRKRLKDDYQDTPPDGSNGAEESTAANIDGKALADELEQELQCACCSALVYRPVVVVPCQHFFCGRYARIDVIATYAHMRPHSCVVMWIQVSACPPIMRTSWTCLRAGSLCPCWDQRSPCSCDSVYH